MVVRALVVAALRTGALGVSDGDREHARPDVRGKDRPSLGDDSLDHPSTSGSDDLPGQLSGRVTVVQVVHRQTCLGPGRHRLHSELDEPGTRRTPGPHLADHRQAAVGHGEQRPQLQDRPEQR